MFPQNLSYSNPQALVSHNAHLLPFENLQHFQNGLLSLMNMRDNLDSKKSSPSSSSNMEDSANSVFPKTLPTFSREGSPFSTTSSISSKGPNTKSMQSKQLLVSGQKDEENSNLSGSDSLVIDTDRDKEKRECNNNEIPKGGMVINAVNLDQGSKNTSDEAMISDDDDEDFTPMQPEVSFRESDEAIGGLELTSAIKNSSTCSSVSSPRSNVATPPMMDLPLALKNPSGSMSICPTTVPVPSNKLGAKKLNFGGAFKSSSLGSSSFVGGNSSMGLSNMAPPPPPKTSIGNNGMPMQQQSVPVPNMQLQEEFLKSILREQHLLLGKQNAAPGTPGLGLDFG